MEIQQHDGVVVELAGSRQGFAKRKREGEVLQGEREAPRVRVQQPSLPPLYRPLEGGRRPWNPSTRGAAARGETTPPPPSQVGRPPPPGFPTLGAGGGPWGPQPTKGWFPSHFSPWGPPG